MGTRMRRQSCCRQSWFGCSRRQRSPSCCSRLLQTAPCCHLRMLPQTQRQRPQQQQKQRQRQRSKTPVQRELWWSRLLQIALCLGSKRDIEDSRRMVLRSINYDKLYCAGCMKKQTFTTLRSIRTRSAPTYACMPSTPATLRISSPVRDFKSNKLTCGNRMHLQSADQPC